MECLNLETSQCRQVPEQFRGNVNITCDTNTITLWNKYKLIAYENRDTMFDTKNSEPYIVSPEFAVEKVLLHNNYILCLDCSGNVNINTKPNLEFNISKDNVTACEIMKSEYVICLEIKEHVTQLSIHEFNEMFLPKHMFTFSNPDDSAWKAAPRSKNIITVHCLEANIIDKQIRLAFDVKESGSDYFLVVICLDKINVYACIISETQCTNLKIANLYRSQSEIVGIHISTGKEICVLVGLSSGNIVKIPLNNNEPKVIHLNTALYKFEVIKNCVLYTDGLTMWKIGDIFSNTDLKPEQIFVKNVRDFCVVGNKIICTTFSNLIYCFYINDMDCYVSPNNESDGQLMTDSYLDKLMSVTRKNEELVGKINKEREYLLALSLSNRQSIMDNLIQITSEIFEDFNDVQEIKDLTLTDNRNEYCDAQSYYFVVKISVTQIQHKLNKLLSGVLGDIKIHITLFADKVVKTISIKINEQLSNKNFVIPLKRSELSNIKDMQIIVKIVTFIPGKMDENQKQWTTLYSKSIELNAENCIRSTNHMNSTCLKEDDMPLETAICDIAKHLYGTQYTFDLID